MLFMISDFINLQNLADILHKKLRTLKIRSGYYFFSKNKNEKLGFIHTKMHLRPLKYLRLLFATSELLYSKLFPFEY